MSLRDSRINAPTLIRPDVRKITLDADQESVPSLGESTIAVASFFTKELTRLGMQINVTGNALDDFELHVKYHEDGDYLNLGLANGDFTTPNYPVINSDITNIAAVVVGDSYLDIDVSAYYSIQIWAASSSASTSGVTISAGGVNG